jgi:hypothetical protein
MTVDASIYARPRGILVVIDATEGLATVWIASQRAL